jgi:hypothetical protein
MRGRFELASASVGGASHRASGRNNQDALCTFSSPEALIAVVADGCGSGRHSEVGAQLGARLTVEALRRHLVGEPVLEAALERTRLDVLDHLRTLTSAMGGDLARLVEDSLLFTLLGAVVTTEDVLVFGLGDGVVAVNDDVHIESYEDNAPPYLGYALLEDGFPLRVHRRIPAADLSSLVIATDGIAPLVGPRFRELWRDDRYFRNPQALSRRLTQLARETPRIDWEARRVARERALLTDDATLVVIRRAPAPS